MLIIFMFIFLRFLIEGRFTEFVFYSEIFEGRGEGRATRRKFL